MTTSTRCRTLACQTVVHSRGLCRTCRTALAASDLDEDTFVRAYQPTLSVQRLNGERCVVARDGARCGRRSISHRSGLCQAHCSQWINSRGRLQVTLEQWTATVARPLPSRPACAVAGCHNDAKHQSVICRGHHLAWQAGRDVSPPGPTRSALAWAARQRPLLSAHQFSLADTAPTLRVELVYALQQRDSQGQRLDPQAVRRLVAALAGVDTLVGVAYGELVERIGQVKSARTYARWVCRVIGLAEITRLRAERDAQQQQLQLALGARLDNIAKADLLARLDELTRHNRDLAADVARCRSENTALNARVVELEDELAAARTSLRRMIRSENLPAT